MIPATQGINRSEKWTAAALSDHNQCLIGNGELNQHLSYPESWATLAGLDFTHAQKRLLIWEI